MPFQPDQPSSFKPDSSASSFKPDGTHSDGSVMGSVADFVRGAINSDGFAEKTLRSSVSPGMADKAQYLSDHAEDVAAGSLNVPAGKLGEHLAYLPKKGADYLMQKAAGITKYIPEVGNKLADMGIWGTRKGIQQAVESKLPQANQELEGVVKNIPSQIDPSEAATRVSDLQSKFTTRGGSVPESSQNAVDSIGQRTNEIMNRGPVDPIEALDYKRVANNTKGFNARSGNPGSALESEMARREGAGYDSALEDAYKSSQPEPQPEKLSQFIPSFKTGAPEALPNAYRDANSNLQALTRVSKAAEKAPTIHKSPLSLQDIGFTTAGGAVGGPSGAIKAYILSRIAASPLFQSILGQGLQKSGNAISSPVVSGGLQHMMQQGASESQDKK